MVSSRATTDVDVVVIGGGAAGIAAGFALRNSSLSICILEARNRVGGRAHTLSQGMPAPLDLGCEWLHSANVNPVVAVAERLGLTIDKRAPVWGSSVGRNFPSEDKQAFEAASSRFWDALERAARDGQADRAASEFLVPNDRWNPLLAAISTYYNGVEPEGVSVIDLDRYVDTGVNWRIAEGYGTFVSRAAAGLDIRFDSAVHLIDHSGKQIRVETTRGTVTARYVVVTVPTDVLVDGSIRFLPYLPDKLAAAASLPLGLADKVFFAVADGAGLVSGHVFGAPKCLEAFSFDVCLYGRPIVEGFVGGRYARALEDAGPAAFEAEARAQLTSALGADVQRHLTFLRSTAWARDPWSRGSYSHARVGAADARQTLKMPISERIYFAGEACSATFFSTAHGAWQSGIDVAAALRATIDK